METKGVGRRRTQLLDDLRNSRRYWELKEKAEDHRATVYYKKIRKKYKSMNLLTSNRASAAGRRCQRAAAL